MKADIIFYLSVIVIIWLFAYDRKNYPKIWPGLWVPLTWILILGSRAPGYWFQSGSVEISPDAYEIGNSFNQKVYSVLILMALLVLMRRHVDWKDVLGRNKAIAAFLAFSALSIIWADFPMVSFKQVIKSTLGNAAMALVVVTDPRPLEAIKALIRRAAYVLIPLSVITIKYFPLTGRVTHQWTYETMYRGVTSGPNGLAALCFICGVLVIWSLIREGEHPRGERWINGGLLAMIAWLFVKADGKTSVVCLAVGITLLVCFRRDKCVNAITAVMRHAAAFIVLGVPVLVLNYAWFVQHVGGLIGSTDTLIGRMELWNRLLSMAGSPFVGLGYGSFWVGQRLERLWAMYSWHPTQAHNGYVEAYLTLGLLGVGFLGAMIIVACRDSASVRLTAELRWLKCAYLLPILLFNLTEAAFKGLHLVWFVFLVLALETKSETTDWDETAGDATLARERLNRFEPPPHERSGAVRRPVSVGSQLLAERRID
jgi:O-antigen ligase